MPVSIEALRAEKHVGEAGDTASGIGTGAAIGTRKSGMDTTAANGAATFSGGTGTGNSRKRVGHCVSAGRLVWIQSKCGAANHGGVAGGYFGAGTGRGPNFGAQSTHG